MPEFSIQLTVNDECHRRSIDPRQSLADFLRENLGLTGTNVGCEHGVCGSCTVRVNSKIVRSCLMLAVQADGALVQTIEGLAGDALADNLKDKFHQHNALQCGYCTPGMLITSVDYLQAGQAVSREAIREHLSGNICRCTGYQSIVDAIVDASSEELR